MELTKKNMLKDIIFILILGGSIWGLSEVVINNVIRSYNLPLRAGILTCFAFLIMGVMSGYIKKARFVLPAVIPAVLIVQLGVVLCGNSPLCRANTCVALLLHSGMVSAFFFASGMGKEKKTWVKAAIVGSAAAFSSAIAFYFIGMRCAPCPYLLSFNSAAGFVSYLTAEALPWMFLGGAGFSAGYLLGTKGAESTVLQLGHIKISRYATGLTVTLICWIISAAVIMA